VEVTRTRRRVFAVTLGTAGLSTPAVAHGVGTAPAGLGFPLVVAASVGASLFGGGLALAVAGRWTVPLRRAVLPVFVVLGGLSVAIALDGVPISAVLGLTAGVGSVAAAVARGRTPTGCGTCADVALGAVTLHRGLEGVVLATLYAADAALGVAGAAIIAVHAAAETAAVGSLYARTRRYALGAVCLLQIGFVAGVVVGWGAVDAVPAALEAGLLALVGGVLLAVGAREGYVRYAGRRPTVAG
jgi:hypothetical protein